MAKQATKASLALRNDQPSARWTSALFEQITDLLAEALVQDIHTSLSSLDKDVDWS